MNFFYSLYNFKLNYGNSNLEMHLEEYVNLILLKLDVLYKNYYYLDRNMPPHFMFSIKTFTFLLAIFGIRAIIPRYRYDQVSRLNWKQLLLVCTSSLILTANLLLILW